MSLAVCIFLKFSHFAQEVKFIGMKLFIIFPYFLLSEDLDDIPICIPYIDNLCLLFCPHNLKSLNEEGGWEMKLFLNYTQEGDKDRNKGCRGEEPLSTKCMTPP